MTDLFQSPAKGGSDLIFSAGFPPLKWWAIFDLPLNTDLLPPATRALITWQQKRKPTRITRRDNL